MLGAPSIAAAHEYYANRVPNTAYATNATGLRRPCITCHDNADGGAGCMPMAEPCLNPFGMAFRAAGFNWGRSLAALDSDADGFTNGQELQEPTGTWTVVEDPPGVAAYVTRPGLAEDSPGRADADGDHICWFGRDLDGDGACTSPMENTADHDCADDDPAVSSAAIEDCANTRDDDCNGLSTRTDPACASVVDHDADGFCPRGEDHDGDGTCIGARDATSAVDCDDDEPTVFPGASENCGDHLDNDCNGLLDQADPICTGDADADADGYCPVGRDLNGDGDCLDAGEPAGGFDCNDAAPTASPANVEVCTDRIDDDCDGLADFRDPECRAKFDADADGYCPAGQDGDGDRYCLDAAELAGPTDCNDTAATIHPGAPEQCTGGIDDDCDGAVDLDDLPDCDGYFDRDGDRYCGAGFDFNRDGLCTAEGELDRAVDCDDTRADVSPAATELCTDGLDNDCNGIADAWDPLCAHDYADFDHDGWCEVGQDLDADLGCADAGEQAGGGPDAAPYDPTVSPSDQENCFDRKDNDQDGLIDADDPDCTSDHDSDGDGHCPVGRDLDGDGRCDGDGERTSTSDCGDGDPAIHPGATEACANWVDDDCDGDVDLIDRDCFVVLDRDGDGFCPTGIDDTRDGDCLDAAEGRFGVDCDDENARVNPRASEVCDDTLDNDCDGLTDAHDPACPCTAADQCDDGDRCTVDRCGPGGHGCVSSPLAECGDAGTGGTAPPPASGLCDCRVTRASTSAAWLAAIALFVLCVRRRVRPR